MAESMEQGLALPRGRVDDNRVGKTEVDREGSQAPVKDEKYKWKVLFTVMTGTVMIILDSTIVNVAFRTLQREFGADLASSQWVLSIYVLSLGITTPVAGYLGDRFGVKRVYLSGLAMFAFGSMMCGLSPTLGVLIVMRALQGIGGGIAQPLGPAMLYRNFPPKEQGFALGIFGIALVVAPALGPIVGGLLVDAGLWRFIFFINIPVGITAVIMGMRFLREGKASHHPALDVPGVILSVIGFGSLLYAATNAQTYGWTSPVTLVTLIIGLATIGMFIYVELYVAKEPLLDLRLFKNKVFTNAQFIGYVSVLALFGAEFLLPLYLQLLRGRTALETGVVLLALAATSAITTPLAGRLYDKIGPRAIISVGYVLLVINTWQLAQLRVDTPFTVIVALLALRGLAFGLTVQSTFVTALGTVPLPLLPRGSSLVNSTRFVVQAIAVALLATVLASNLSPAVQQYQNQAQQSVSDTYTSMPFGLCETPGVAAAQNYPPGALDSIRNLTTEQQADAKKQIMSLVNDGCQQYIKGFESAYTLTFIFALVSLGLSLLLPGWPGEWSGRGSYSSAPASGH